MIIDAHCHLGKDVVFDLENSESDLILNFKKFGIDAGIVQPFIGRPYLEDIKAEHNRIYALTQEYPGSFFGLASINPHFRYKDFEEEARRCIRELNFVGLKITPPGHAVHPLSKDALHVYDVALDLGVPVMIHTGFGIPFADPIHLAGVAEKYPDLTIIMAHAGSNFYVSQAIFVAKNYDNVFVEPSGSGISETHSLISTLGSAKVMFSTDTIEQIPAELNKYKAIVESDSDRLNVFQNTVLKSFNIQSSDIHSISDY